MKVVDLDLLIEKIKEADKESKEFSVCLEPDSLVELCQELGVEPKKVFPYKDITIKLLQRF